MEKPSEMNTLSNIMEKLRLKGLDDEFRLSDHGKLQSPKTQKIYNPDDLTIIKTFRFEGESDPSDSSVLYLMEDAAGNMGYVIDAFGAYSNHEGPAFDDFLKKIPVTDRDEQELFK